MAMLAHYMWSWLRGAVENVDTSREIEQRKTLHKIRAMERHDMMGDIEKAEGLGRAIDGLVTFHDDLVQARDELQDGNTSTLRKMFGDGQVDALLAKEDEDA